MAGRGADGTAACSAQARSGTDGRFALVASDAPLAEGSLYPVARGGTPTAGKGGQSMTDNGPLTRKPVETVDQEIRATRIPERRKATRRLSTPAASETLIGRLNSASLALAHMSSASTH